MKLEVQVFINQLSVKRLTIFNTSKKEWQLMETNIGLRVKLPNFWMLSSLDFGNLLVIHTILLILETPSTF